MIDRINRRGVMAGAALIAGSPFIPRAWALAPGRDPRLLVIVLRGAMDGLAAVMPTGDPAFAAMRAQFVVGDKPAIPLDGFFQLNGNMPALGALYKAREALFFQAVATPYRGHSHFDAQEVLESGLGGAGGATTGWLNRALAGMPMIKGERVGALAVAATMPLVLRGPAAVESWQPQVLDNANADLANRLLGIYDARDPALATALRKGVGIDDYLGETPMIDLKTKGPAHRDLGFASAADSVAKLMRRPDGPRVAVLNYNGWDTHAMEGAYDGRLGKQLASFDAGIAALHIGLAELWRDTAILVVTEFGRTANINGARGTDHGTGGVAFLLGGAVNGGRVVADWPGLGPSALLDGRDLRPTTDLRSILMAVLRDHMAVATAAMTTSIFPDSGGVKMLRDLIRA